jgi:hypothetical protein
MWSIGEKLTDVQALTMGLADTFMLLAAMILFIFVLIPFMPSKMPRTADAEPISAD